MSKIELKNGEYYAEGERVFRAPIHKPQPDGSTNISMGFPVCTVSDYLNEDAAQEIARCLNEDGVAEQLRAAINLTIEKCERGESPLAAISWLTDWNEGDSEAMQELNEHLKREKADG